LLVTDYIHILTISETHLDNTFDDTVVAIHGYNIYRRDRNANEGNANIPVKLREYIMSNAVEVIWLQIHLPHLKPIIVGRSYRPSANSLYLDYMCEMLDHVCDINRGIFSGCPKY
jgi:hypothetical protein